jgi:S1-C subfamily serine protease
MIFLKRTLAITVIFFLIFSSLLYIQTLSSTNVTKNNRPTYQYLRDVTVRIEGQAYDNNSQQNVAWCGTGVVVKQNNLYTYILTNRHVIGGDKNDDLDCVQLRVIDDRRGYPHVAEVISTHNYYDMAIITVRGKLNGKRIIQGVGQAQIQDPVYLVGESLGRHLIYGEGVVAGYDNTDTIIQLPSIYGNSGSGVFNEDGILVGLLYSCTVIPVRTMYGDYGFVPVFTHANIIDGIYIQLYLNEVLN